MTHLQKLIEQEFNKVKKKDIQLNLTLMNRWNQKMFQI